MVEVKSVDDRGFSTFDCTKCGEETKNSYVEPVKTQMLEHGLCYHCNYWRDFLTQKPPSTIIGGRIYSPGNRTSGSFRGMAGRRFDIEYIAGAHEGKRITTFDLWAGGEIPEEYRDRYPDTARFLNGAEQADASGITCWNPSSRKSEQYPLPHAAGIR